MYNNKNSNSRTQLGKDLFALVSLLVVMTVVAVGSVEQSPENVDPNEFVEATDIDTDVGGKLKFIGFEKNTSIKDALRVLSAKYNKNIVPSLRVDGILGFTSLRDVTFEEAMDAILGENFEYEQKGNIIKVYTTEEYKEIMEDEERMRYEVFTLYYISAAEAKKLISPVLSSAGTIQASSPAEKIVPTGESISMGSGGGDTMALNDTIVILDYPENIAKAEKMLKELDVRPRQVLVEATILSATLTEGMELGVDLQTLLGSISSVSDITRESYEYIGSSSTSQVTKSGGLTVGFVHDNVGVFIQALEEITDTTILANPKILAVNKQLGQVFIGTKIGYVSQTTQTETSTTQMVEFLDTGTKLSFRPYIGNDGYIRMDIQPKDSSGILKANSIPDESSTELATNVIVKDGQTIVIGGLFRDVVVTSRSQIPLLGDLPLVGAAFRGTSDSVTRQEVIVLLTPHIIKEPEETDSDARVDDVRRKRFGAKDSMQWLGRARLAEDCYAKAAKYYLEGDNESAMSQLSIALALRPTYLEALRLKERIIAETDPDEAEKLERIMLEGIDCQEAPNWLRR